MSLCLEQHGWKGCVIPLSLEDVELHLPTWRDLQVLRPPETYGRRTLCIPYVPIQDNIFPAFQMGDQIDEGTYGQIVKAERALYCIVDPAFPTRIQRIGDFAQIVCKVNEIEDTFEGHGEKEAWYAEEVQALLHEASLHALAYHMLVAHGHPHVIPQLYEVYAKSASGARHIEAASDVHSVVIGMEFVRGTTLHRYFADHFLQTDKPRVREGNDRQIMDILIQLSIYLEILQVDLRFNHRDLKINNVLRRNHTRLWFKSLEHPALTRPWIAFQDLVIIDFGFSCVACDDSRKSLIQAGSWFKPSHDCLKRGRDIALFLYSLQCYYPLEGRISQKLLHILQSACTILYGGAPLPLLTTAFDSKGAILQRDAVLDVSHFGDGIYKFLRREDVDVAGCTPATLLAALDALRGGIEKVDPPSVSSSIGTAQSTSFLSLHEI